MPEQQLPRPRNIFEAMHLNIFNLGQNQKTILDEMSAMRKEISELRAMFNTPATEPNASGDGTAVEE